MGETSPSGCDAGPQKRQSIDTERRNPVPCSPEPDSAICHLLSSRAFLLLGLGDLQALRDCCKSLCSEVEDMPPVTWRHAARWVQPRLKFSGKRPQPTY